MLIKRLINWFKRRQYLSSSEEYSKYLRRNGISVGDGNSFRPKTTEIDMTRPSLVTIGSNCYFNEGFTILTHDWVTNVFINAGLEFLPSSGRVSIGNNVSTGQNVTILKGVTIGDNVFIGANSVVTKDIPSNSIAVGIPCKVVMPLQEYFMKRKEICIKEALDYALSIQQRFGRRPVETDFWEEFPLFVDGDKINQHPEIASIIKRQLGPYYNDYVNNHVANYKTFDDFLNAAGIK